MRLFAALKARAGLTDKQAFQISWMEDLASFFEGMSRESFNDLARWVVEHELWPKRRKDVIAAIKLRQQAGEKLVIASGSYEPIVRIFAKRLGAEALGTELELDGSRYTGKLTEAINVQTYKAQKLKTFLNDSPLSAAYGDTEADIPMMMLSEQPVAVYPDKTLARMAKDLGWSRLS